MRNPKAPDQGKGHGRQVSFIINKGQRKPTFTDWMKHRVDSDKGKQIYSHRMSVVEPVFANIKSKKTQVIQFKKQSKSTGTMAFALYGS
jgi:hypothetical protein